MQLDSRPRLGMPARPRKCCGKNTIIGALLRNLFNLPAGDGQRHLGRNIIEGFHRGRQFGSRKDAVNVYDALVEIERLVIERLSKGCLQSAQ